MKRRATPQRTLGTHDGNQLSLFESLTIQLLQALRSLDLDALSPGEAAATLAEFQQRAQRLP